MCADYRPCHSERVGRAQRIRPWPHVGRHPKHRSIIETTASHVARTQYRARVDFRQIPASAALRGHFHCIAKAGAATTSPLVSAWPVRSSADIGLPVSARTGRPRAGAGGAIHESVRFVQFALPSMRRTIGRETPSDVASRASCRYLPPHGFHEGTPHVVLDPSTSCGTSVCRTPSGQPPAVQIGNPADLASLASPPSSHDRAPTSPVTTACSSDEVGGESLRPASGRRDTPSSCLLVLSHSTARLSEHPLPHQSRALGLGIGELPLQDFEGVGPESGSSPANGARRIG